MCPMLYGMFACVLAAVADSPSIDDEPRSESVGAGATPLTSRLTSETSAAADVVQRAVSASSLQPLVFGASRQSNFHSGQTTASSLASSDSVARDCTEVTLNTAASVITAQLSCGLVPPQPVTVQPETAGTSSNLPLPESEATLVPRSSSSHDGSNSSSRQSASPEINVLPAVKRWKPALDHDPASSSAGFVNKLQSVSSDDNTVEPSVSRSTYRCGSPGLDEDGEFSCHKPKPASVAVTLSQSNTSGCVKLIPLSHVMSRSISSQSSDTAAERLSVKITHVDQISVEAKDNKFFRSPVRSRSVQTSKEQADSVQTKPKATRRQSTRLRAPDSTAGRVKQRAVNGTKSVKFDVRFTNAEPTDKENVNVQRTTLQQAGLSSQHENGDISHTLSKSRSSSCNSSLSGEESDISSAKVRRSFIKCAQPDDADDTGHEQRLPRAWERRADSSPVASRRTSGRIKQKETDAQPSECEKSPRPVSGRKRSASSGSSGPSSSEKKPAKKLTKMTTIAMTSLHSE